MAMTILSRASVMFWYAMRREMPFGRGPWSRYEPKAAEDFYLLPVVAIDA
jgi:hypothetical protein